MRWAGRTCDGTLEGTVGFRKPFVGDTAKSGSRGPTTLHRGWYARFNGTAPIPASSGEGNGEPVRHRLNQQGNRATNAVLHRMAVTQLRCHPPARDLYDKARRNGHTKREAMRVLKRHLSNVAHRRMLADWHAHNGQNVLPQAQEAA
ncbi:MAG: transposase [Acidimicrobiales bacterium]